MAPRRPLAEGRADVDGGAGSRGAARHRTVPDPAPGHQVALRVGSFQAVLRTDPSLFSYTHLDPGTAVLLRTAPAPPVDGDLLDLGCGWGPVAVTLAARHPDRIVWAVDADPRAIAITQENAQRLGLANVRATPPGEAAPARFAAIYSNPPVRVGKRTMRDLLIEWLPRLDAGACAYLVVKKNLGADGLARFLTDEGWPTGRLCSKRCYRVLCAEGHGEGTPPAPVPPPTRAMENPGPPLRPA